MSSQANRVSQALFVGFLVINAQITPSVGAGIRGVQRKESSKGRGDPGVSDRTAKRMGAVVDALTDLLSSIESEEKAEAANYKCFMEWCDKSLTAKKGEVKEAEIELENNNVEVDQHTSKVETTKYEINKLKTEIEETSEALQQAEGIRDKDNAAYSNERTQNLQAIKQLEKAIKIVAKGALIQRAKDAQHAPGESKFILGTLKQLKKGMEKNQAEEDAEEAKKKQDYDALYKTKTGQLNQLTKTTEKKQVLVTDTNVALAQTKNDIATVDEALKEDKTFLEETQKECAQKEKDWQIRSEDRAKEKAAIREAISFLIISFKKPQAEALVQTADLEESDALSFLQARPGEHRRSSSQDYGMSMLDATDAELSALTGKADSATKKEAFAKVKMVIQDLIEVLETEQKDEYAKTKMCKSKFKTKGEKKDKTSDQIGMLEAKIESTGSEVETLTSEVKEINRLMQNSKTDGETASKLRQEQRKSFEVGTKDRKLAIKVISSAKAVLMKFYDSAGFVQKSSKTSKGQSSWNLEDSPRKTGEGNIVIQMMDKIIDDVRLEQKDAQSEENDAQAAYDEFLDKSSTEYDARMEEINAKVTRKARLKVRLENDGDTLDQQNEKMTALKEQIKALHEECDGLLKSFGKRTKAREFEIAQLKDVMDILSGSSEAVRTGLVEEPDDDAEEDREMAQLEGMSHTTSDIAANARRLVAK